MIEFSPNRRINMLKQKKIYPIVRNEKKQKIYLMFRVKKKGFSHN